MLQRLSSFLYYFRSSFLSLLGPLAFLKITNSFLMTSSSYTACGDSTGIHSRKYAEDLLGISGIK